MLRLSRTLLFSLPPRRPLRRSSSLPVPFMNDSDPSPINLDELRLLPAWLREGEAEPANRYASHNYPLEGERERRGGGGQGRGDGARRPDFGNRDRSGGGGGGGQGRGDGARRPDRNRSGPPSSRSGPPRRDRDDRRPSGPPPAPVVPAPVGIQFLPDERCLESIVKQIRSRHMAYPLFGLARMFLQEPARHWLEISVLPAAVEQGTTLYQLGEDGPVVTDRAALERIAFDSAKAQFYIEETVQKDPPKGNFTSVARCRLSGTLLGPTNYHGYQPALRSLYERRFSRQMSFEDYRRNVEVVSDPALVEKWKEDVRTVRTIRTLEGEPPTVFNNVGEARAHFRANHFEAMVRTGQAFKLPGAVARNLPEPGMMQTIRQAHEPELRYPGRFVQLLREALQNAGLHIFKHRKRFVYVATSRPTTFSGSEVLTETVAAILKTVGENPLITRKVLAEKILAGIPVAADDAPPEDPYVKARAALAADLRFLVQSGHLIEFHNGTFDLPLPPKPKVVVASTPIIGEAAVTTAEPAAPGEEAAVDPEPVEGENPEEVPATPVIGEAALPPTETETAAPASPVIGEAALEPLLSSAVPAPAADAEAS